AFNGEVLFGGVDAAGLNALFAYNGQSVSEISINGAYFGGINLSDLTVFNQEVLFNGFDATGKQGLWVTDGTTAGTHEIAVNGAAPGGLNPSDFTTFNHRGRCSTASTPLASTGSGKATELRRVRMR